MMVHPESLDAARAREVARAEFDAWIASAPRPEAARRSIAPDAALRSTTLARVEAVLAHPHCGAANRRWICELARAWAPLEVLFPTRDYRGMKGVSGELPLHVALLVEREYGHILGVARSLPGATGSRCSSPSPRRCCHCSPMPHPTMPPGSPS
jgi:hypothetical protein